MTDSFSRRARRYSHYDCARGLKGHSRWPSKSTGAGDHVHSQRLLLTDLTPEGTGCYYRPIMSRSRPSYGSQAHSFAKQVIAIHVLIQGSPSIRHYPDGMIWSVGQNSFLRAARPLDGQVTPRIGEREYRTLRRSASLRECASPRRRFARHDHYIAAPFLRDIQQSSRRRADDYVQLKTSCWHRLGPEAQIAARCHRPQPPRGLQNFMQLLRCLGVLRINAIVSIVRTA